MGCVYRPTSISHWVQLFTPLVAQDFWPTERQIMLQKSEKVIRQMYVCAPSFLHVCLFVTPWTVTLQAPLPLVFSRQEYWSGLQFSPPGDLPDPEMEPMSPASLALAGRFFTTEPPQANLHISFCDPVRSQIKKKKIKEEVYKGNTGLFCYTVFIRGYVAHG